MTLWGSGLIPAVRRPHRPARGAERSVDQVTNGRTTTVLIGGAAGVGKTRLVEEFQRSSRPACASRPTAADSSTHRIVGIVRDVLSQVDTAADVVGPVARGLGINTSGDVLPDGEFARTRLFESILTFVTKVAQQSPVVLALEDVH